MKKIVVQWIPESTYEYGMAMKVIKSNHPRFTVNTRFDYGFFGIATKEGYTITSLPMDKNKSKSINVNNLKNNKDN